jgi:hypothetical protein
MKSADSGNVGGHKLRFASHQAAHFLELGLFLAGKGMSVFPVSIKFHMIADKSCPRESRNQVEVLIEFIRDRAAERETLPYDNADVAMFDGRLRGLIKGQ